MENLKDVRTYGNKPLIMITGKRLYRLLRSSSEKVMVSIDSTIDYECYIPSLSIFIKPLSLNVFDFYLYRIYFERNAFNGKIYITIKSIISIN